MKRKILATFLGLIICLHPENLIYADSFPIRVEGEKTINDESAYWEYLEETYPSVTVSDIESGKYAESYVIIDMVAKNVNIQPSIEYISCDMYCNKGDDTYHKQDLWCTFYGDSDLKENGFVCGKDYLINMQENDLLKCCCYVNSDNSYGGSKMLAIKKIGTAKEDFKYTESIYFDFYNSVPNDVTGKWRLATTSNAADITSYALNYYKAYFKSDDEIHGIVNKKAGTTCSLSVTGNTLNVISHSYVEGEENDAKMLFCGDVIAEYFINIETGEIEKL